MKVITTNRSQIKEGNIGTAVFAYAATVFPESLPVEVYWYNVTFKWGGTVLQQLGRDIRPVATAANRARIIEDES